MKIIWICLLSLSTIFASEYYAKLEPIDSFQVKSAVAGKVVFSNSKIEGLKANNSTIIELDSSVNKIELEQSKNKLKYIEEMITIEKNNYDRLNQVSSKSAFEKDTQKLKVINIESSQAEMIIKNESLKDNTGKEAWNPDGLMQRAIRAIKAACPEMIVMPDVALDPYSN